MARPDNSHTQVIAEGLARPESFNRNPERRALICAELDANYARLYGLSRGQRPDILNPAGVNGGEYAEDTFRGFENNEIALLGECHIRRLVLESWDRLASGTLA